MLKNVFRLIGLAEVLSPDGLIDRAERLALENPDECDVRSWIPHVARAEGIVFLYLTSRSDASYAAFKKFLGVIGILAMLYPKLYVDYAADIAYVDSERCQWNSWVYPVTRLVGVAYVLLALNEFRKGDRSEA
ncbi:MAG: hypothetical protein ACQETB_07600 [Halobacteriota archaeon]